MGRVFSLVAASPQQLLYTFSVPKPKLGRAAHHRKAAIYTYICKQKQLGHAELIVTLLSLHAPRNLEKKGCIWFDQFDSWNKPITRIQHVTIHRWTTSPRRSVQESYNTQAIPLANYESKKSPTGPTVHRPWKNPSI